jgi:hypothetical protein
MRWESARGKDEHRKDAVMKIDERRRKAMQWGASDVHLAVPDCPMFRMQNGIIMAGHVCAKGAESKGKAR